MSWVKIDDAFPDHPKVQAAGPLASWLCVAGWCYAARYRTDGFLPRAVIARLIDSDGRNASELADVLVEAGLWEALPNGFQIHDYLEYNPSAESAAADREAAKARMQRVRSTRRSGIGAKAYLEQSASEPGVIGGRQASDFEHLPEDVRKEGRRIRDGITREERDKRLAAALKTLGL